MPSCFYGAFAGAKDTLVFNCAKIIFFPYIMRCARYFLLCFCA